MDFWLKSYKLVTQPAPGSSASLWGTNKLIDGWLALADFGGGSFGCVKVCDGGFGAESLTNV